ncbi:MAG TPA: CxxxxCH/CxxCH domain-containing protein [Candidatus Acidoferrales bacterium]|nr:CxxxxCH/CxxCH domain-containing protein [Candidatus Acidoferrales bacterium]
MKKYLGIGRLLFPVNSIVVLGLIFSSCSKLQNNVLAPPQSQSNIHPVGWGTQGSANFHGTYIRNNNYDMTTCTSCHGSDLNGGIAKRSCYDCHGGTNGTLACNTCHGSALNAAPPKDLSGDSVTTNPTVGAHQSHVATNNFFANVSCSSCHLVPETAGPGLHPFGTKVSVLFSGVSLTQTNLPGSRYYDSTMATVKPVPIFNFQTLQCSNTYCHGNFKNGNNFSPKWTAVDGSQDSCGSCHGLPPHGAINGIVPVYQSESAQNCFLCHEPMMGQTGIQDKSLHVNGKLELYGNSQDSW